MVWRSAKGEGVPGIGRRPKRRERATRAAACCVGMLLLAEGKKLSVRIPKTTIRLRFKRAGARKPCGRGQEGSGFYSQAGAPPSFNPGRGRTHPGPSRLRGLLHAQAHLLIHSQRDGGGSTCMHATVHTATGAERHATITRTQCSLRVVGWDAWFDKGHRGCVLRLFTRPPLHPSTRPQHESGKYMDDPTGCVIHYPSQHIVISSGRARKTPRQPTVPSQPQPAPAAAIQCSPGA